VNIPSLVSEFFSYASEQKLRFYNEPCVQLELAIFLRSKLSPQRIQLERPITDFTPVRNKGGKKEIDICILSEEHQPDIAIEIKYPRNGRIPETIFDYCKDIEFCEALCASGFRFGYALFVTADTGFFAGRESGGIYSSFRTGSVIAGSFSNPTGEKKKQCTLAGSYTLKWSNAHQGHRYALIEVTPANNHR